MATELPPGLSQRREPRTAELSWQEQSSLGVFQVMCVTIATHCQGKFPYTEDLRRLIGADTTAMGMARLMLRSVTVRLR